ncbi:MAG: nucleotidyltransferase family protein [Oscillospiraceae bacterium]|nr:nucleotidyltransferase family protein [Oscillospiraceae bacterium]
MTTGCVILAAGNAVRFGSNKLLACYDGKPLIRRAFDAVPTELLGPVAVVTQYDAVAELAEGYGFSALRNDAPELGIGHSVALGARAVGPACDGLLFLVADQPLLRRATVVRIVERFAEDPTRIVVPAAGERQGNPCVFPAACFPALQALCGDRGGKQLLRRFPELVETIQVDAPELADVDTLADLQKILYKSNEM